MTEEANERLRQFLNEGRNWERKATNISGGNMTTILQPGNNLILNGLMDVGTNHHKGRTFLLQLSSTEARQ